MSGMVSGIKKADGADPCEMEVCVVCGRMTDIPRDTPISLRKTYVQAAGQLCEECFKQIYHAEDMRSF